MVLENEEKLKLLEKQIEDLHYRVEKIETLLSRMMPILSDNVRQLADLRHEIKAIFEAARRRHLRKKAIR